jgi:hypothetical protein
VVLAAAGCASFQPIPAVEGDFTTRAQTQSANGVTVSTAVLSADEGERVFGLPLEKSDIQPVWLRIENRSEFTYLFVPAGLDPDYFSSQEVAWANRSRYSAEDRRAMEADLDRKTIRTYFPPGTAAEGFVHTTLDALGEQAERPADRTSRDADIHPAIVIQVVPGHSMPILEQWIDVGRTRTDQWCADKHVRRRKRLRDPDGNRGTRRGDLHFGRRVLVSRETDRGVGHDMIFTP